MNKLSALFNRRDRKPRHSRSVSTLPRLENDWDEVQVDRGTVGDPVALDLDISRGQHFQPMRPLEPLRQPPHPPPPTKAIAPIPTAIRASTVPTIRLHPPDELYLRVIRRRSANAMLEPQRVSNESVSLAPDETLLKVAIAAALPPEFLHSPQSYTIANDGHDLPFLAPVRSQSTVLESQSDEIFVHPPRLQMGGAMRRDSSIVVTQATPTETTSAPFVSPITDLDQFYHERRRKKKREAEATKNLESTTYV